MPAVHLKPALVTVCLMLAACLAAAPVTPPWTDEIPMCGGQDRSTPAVKAADAAIASGACRCGAGLAAGQDIEPGDGAGQQAGGPHAFGGLAAGL